jgi:hypothetical protein
VNYNDTVALLSEEGDMDHSMYSEACETKDKCNPNEIIYGFICAFICTLVIKIAY